MSAAKRTTVRRKKTTKKITKKVTATSRVVKKSVVKKRAAKKVVKKVARRAVKKSTSLVPKKVTKKTVKKAVSRSRRVVKLKTPQTVREARFGGHKNTIPKNPKAPGSILGRTFALSLAAMLARIPFDTDAVAITVARFGGISIMVLGAGFSWHLFNLIVEPTLPPQAAAVIESVPSAPTVSFTQPMPLTDVVPVMVAQPEATQILLLAAVGDLFVVLGEAKQQTEETWQFLLPTTDLVDGEYQLHTLVTNKVGESQVFPGPTFEVANNTLEPAESAPTATSTATTTTTDVALASSTTTTALSDEPAAVTAPIETSVDDQASTTETALRVPVGEMPLLLAPTVRAIVELAGNQMLVVGEGTPEQLVETLIMRDQQVASTTVQTNGWWTLKMDAPVASDEYELYAQASPELLSGPLDFSVIAGRLVQVPPTGDSQLTTVAESRSTNEMLVWYLLAACATVGVGAVVLLLGHHLHHTRPKKPTLDQTA